MIGLRRVHLCPCIKKKYDNLDCVKIDASRYATAGASPALGDVVPPSPPEGTSTKNNNQAGWPYAVCACCCDLPRAGLLNGREPCNMLSAFLTTSNSPRVLLSFWRNSTVWPESPTPSARQLRGLGIFLHVHFQTQSVWYACGVPGPKARPSP
ncbi:hypothetical protein AOQ84DRAFT_150101 [Glonium stellatum]|uniref:Uncharacterized protein n=1 Tax=Glonium stellatum TaxID=574774 RepID=A0A8E2FE19_9PEZI|nr:hypothetical protein AOQ84DRAFT_150101 [Glonium stellatum]